jgi:sigma-B regulation protein RsbQ
VVGKFERLHGTITGQGSTTVVLGHGFGTDQTAWTAVRGWLDRHYRVVSYDLAGAGVDGEVNYEPRRYGSLFGYADDLLEIADELALQQCIYVGHSVSCMIGIAASIARPQLFGQLLLIGGSPRYLNEPGYRGGFDQSDLNGVYDGMAANFQAWAAGFVPMVVGVPDNAALDEFSRMLFLMRPDIALTTCRTIFQSDMREIVPRLRLPTHLVQTRVDMAVPLDVAHWLHQRIAGSTLDVIDAEGHVPHMTAPDEIIGIFERHLSPSTIAA